MHKMKSATKQQRCKPLDPKYSSVVQCAVSKLRPMSDQRQNHSTVLCNFIVQPICQDILSLFHWQTIAKQTRLLVT